MYFPERKSNYEKRPLKHIDGYENHIWQGYEKIVQVLKEQLQEDDVLVMELYHGTDLREIEEKLIRPLGGTVFFAEEAKLPEEKLYPRIERNVTDDRVFGSLSTHNMNDFYDPEKTRQLRQKIRETEGLRIVYGTGAAYVCPEGKIIYGDLTRWEIQLRYRKGLDNWGVGNHDDDILRKYKRGYFVEWRMQDRHKVSIFDRVLYWLDTNRKDDPSMIDAALMRHSLDVFSSSPFRLIPYFDEGVWGGTWMKEVCDLPESRHNYAWCFDGVPEENSIGIEADGIVFEMPAMNLVKERARKLLGDHVYARFGAEFPIRFDFLDTMQGQNLSLQVHPVTEYIHENFGMAYTQDESYYILDAREDAHVYLGVKNGVTEKELIPALERAGRGEEMFDADRYINCFPAHKHDHFLIPSGTIHCSGADAMVLEISATPYIFTFKLWDWGRLGLDGKPRPINVERGRHVIRYERDTDWCQKNIVNHMETLQEEPGLKVERTGLHELEFIETRRYWFDHPVTFDCFSSVNMLNLIEGEEARITSVDGSFEPMTVHYAETFILPESVKSYIIEPYGLSAGKTIGVIQAAVRV
jgi:mannose-6-phosphate isomerase class I